jgi:hypothetical protein
MTDRCKFNNQLPVYKMKSNNMSFFKITLWFGRVKVLEIEWFCVREVGKLFFMKTFA